MKKALALSVIIPAYNEEAYIERCLDGLARQTILPDEVILVDNNSTDQTAVLARRYPFLTLINESRQGLYYARQTGMAVATGDILCRIDADTVADEDWVEQILIQFSDPSVNAVTGPVGYHDFILPQVGRWIEDKCLRLARKIRYDFLFGCNMAIRRTVWQEIADDLCSDSHLMEDIDVTTHFVQHGYKTVYCPNMRVLVSARRAEDSPGSFYRYIKGHSRTMRHHSLPIIGALYSEFAFLTTYILIKPLHLLYDPMEKKFTWRRLFDESYARPDPMNPNVSGRVSQSRVE